MTLVSGLVYLLNYSSSSFSSLKLIKFTFSNICNKQLVLVIIEIHTDFDFEKSWIISGFLRNQYWLSSIIRR